jgi:hypothetical protein
MNLAFQVWQSSLNFKSKIIMRKVKLFSLIGLLLVMSTYITSAQKRAVMNLKVTVTCTGEILSGAVYIHDFGQGPEINGVNKSFMLYHSGELTSNLLNVYRLAGCSDEIIVDENGNRSYYGVWHFVGKKGNVIRVIVTTEPKPLSDLYIGKSLDLFGECE